MNDTDRAGALVVLGRGGVVARAATVDEAVEYGQANDRGSFQMTHAFERATRIGSGVVVDRVGSSAPPNQPWMD